jgi:hypothetical protein
VRRSVLASLFGVAVVLSAALFAHADAAIRLEIGGQQVNLDPPPLIIGDRVLVPVRGVFEQLGATLAWEDPATHAVIVSRAVPAGGGTQIRLIAGSRVAYINDSPVTLDVAPIIFTGRTFVPLRFVGEALQATVAWNPGLRVVAIAPAVAPPSLPPAALPTPPKEGPAEGTVVRVDVAAVPPAVIITWYGNQTRPFTVAPDTVFFRRDLDTNRVEPIQLRQVFPGDALSLVVDVGGGPRPRGAIRRGEVLVREARGRVESAAGRTLVLADGRSFVLAASARFIVGGSVVAQPPDLAEKLVIVRVQPLTQQVVEVEVAG